MSRLSRVLLMGFITLAAAAAGAQQSLAPDPAPPAELPPAHRFELKGLWVGMSLDGAKAAMQPDQCRDLYPGVTRCVRNEATVNGIPGRQKVEILDGRVINIEFYELKFPESESLRDALISKYGNANKVVGGTALNGLLDVRDTAAVYWFKDDLVLGYIPWGSTKVRARALATLRLHDDAAYAVQWVPRARGEYIRQEGASDL